MLTLMMSRFGIRNRGAHTYLLTGQLLSAPRPWAAVRLSGLTTLLVLTVWCSTIAQSRQSTLAFTHVTVIDPISGNAEPDMTVVVTGKRIARVGKTVSTRLPTAAHVVDGTGKFLIPGLWDSHIHLSMWTDLALPLLVANGITAVRDMGGDIKEINGWRTHINEGSIIGPFIIRPGPLIDGPKPGAIYRLTVRNADDARAAVKKLEKEGVDFIKIHNGVPRDAYITLSKEAKRAGLKFVGHIPVFVTPEEASAAGQATIEHSESLFEAYAFQLALKRTTDLREAKEASVEEMFKASQLMLDEVLKNFTDERASSVFSKFAQNRNAYTPVLIAYKEATQRRSSQEPLPDPRLKYLAISAIRVWDQWFPWRQASVESLAKREVAFKRFLELARLAADNGVQILAGSDHFPGSSLHDELALLVKSGLTPLQALQAATLTPAIIFGMLGHRGTIEQGKRADLVLLDASPLDDIRNTRRINAVVLAGKLLDRKHLDQILSEIEAAARTR